MIDDATFIRFLESWRDEDGIDTIDKLIECVKQYGVDWEWYEEDIEP